jgi:hypothetical protein
MAAKAPSLGHMVMGTTSGTNSCGCGTRRELARPRLQDFRWRRWRHVWPPAVYANGGGVRDLLLAIGADDQRHGTAQGGWSRRTARFTSLALTIAIRVILKPCDDTGCRNFVADQRRRWVQKRKEPMPREDYERNPGRSILRHASWERCTRRSYGKPWQTVHRRATRRSSRATLRCGKRHSMRGAVR